MTEKPRRKATLSEMADLVASEARRIRIVQPELVRSGAREKPDERQMRNAEMFDDIEMILRAIEPVQAEVRKILAPVIKAMSTAKNFKRQDPEPPAPDRHSEENSDD